MLEAVHLTKHYNGVAALDDLTLRVMPGDVFCLLGANGAGKTTTINLFLNFVEPTSGLRASGDTILRPELNLHGRFPDRLGPASTAAHVPLRCRRPCRPSLLEPLVQKGQHDQRQQS